jgi:hypothetical protein
MAQAQPERFGWAIAQVRSRSKPRALVTDDNHRQAANADSFPLIPENMDIHFLQGSAHRVRFMPFIVVAEHRESGEPPS